MNLLQIRTWFVRESGRYYLVVDNVNYVDNGANNHINAAIRMLDRMQTTPFTEGHNWQQVLVNARYVVFGSAFRSIHSVFVTLETGGTRSELTLTDYKTMKEYHFSVIAGAADTGNPLYYRPAVFRLAPELEQAIGDIDVPANYLDYIGESPYKYNGVMFYPPCNDTYDIETWGYVYSKELSHDADENWWTYNHPELVVMATQLVLEKMMRNTEGVKDWAAAIKMELQGIDFTLWKGILTNISQMGG